MGPEFKRSLRRIAKPKLESVGFIFDGKRRFTKSQLNGNEQIIEYQIGARFMQGRFTVNLISGERFERIAMIKPTYLLRWVNKLFGDYDPWWKDLFLPKDNWWKISPFQKEMDSIMEKSVVDITSFGITWFDTTE